MSRFDDDLRAVLHGHAERVVPSADPLAGVERRVQRIRRRRRAAAAAGSALSVLVVAVAAPAVGHHVQGGRSGVDQADATGLGGAASLEGAGSARLTRSAAPAPDLPARPPNYLNWPTRG